MSTVCYCGQPDCPVTTWERDACVTNLRAERDALLAERDELRAQVDRLRGDVAEALCERDGFESIATQTERHLSRAVKVLDDLVSLAARVMKAANCDGAEYDIDEELRDARVILISLCVGGVR